MTTNVKSINVNTVFNKKEVLNHMNKPLFHVKGWAMAVIGVNTKYGEQIGFRGDFLAINQLTGEVFTSEAAFLPKSETRSIEKLLSNPENHEVEIDMVIQATETDKNDKGYAWIAVMPKTEAQQNRFEKLKIEAEKAAQQILKLEPPKTEETVKEKAAKKTA